MTGFIDGARCPVQIDVGYGDAVIPSPDSACYPVIFDDMPAPNLQVYPKYTVVAEKLEAIITMGMANTRMKDYFDLWIILKGSQLDREILAQAVTATLSRRNTQRPASIPTGLCDQFSADRQKMTQWAAFVKRNDLVAASLEETIKDIRSALMFLFQEATG